MIVDHTITSEESGVPSDQEYYDFTSAMEKKWKLDESINLISQSCDTQQMCAAGKAANLPSDVEMNVFYNRLSAQNIASWISPNATMHTIMTVRKKCAINAACV